jgi:hypothetical protein
MLLPFACHWFQIAGALGPLPALFDAEAQILAALQPSWIDLEEGGRNRKGSCQVDRFGVVGG